MYYIRLLSPKKLSQEQQHIWNSVVDAVCSPIQTDVGNQTTQMSAAEELKGDDKFPFVYVAYIPHLLARKTVELVVKTWSKIFPVDFEIETTADVDDATADATQQFVSKRLHNEWVVDQIANGWRYGMDYDRNDKTDPRLLNWDTLDSAYRTLVPMTKQQVRAVVGKYS